MEIDEGAFQELLEVVRCIAERVQNHDEMLDDLTQKKITDRLDGIESEFGKFTGGLNDIIDGRRKREYTDQLRTNKPDLGKYEGIGKRFGIDVYNTVADKTFDMSDEDREGAIGEMMKELSEKFDDLISALETHNAHESAETPGEEAAEHSPEKGGIEIEVESGPKADPTIVEMARKMKQRAENK